MCSTRNRYRSDFSLMFRKRGLGMSSRARSPSTFSGGLWSTTTVRSGHPRPDCQQSAIAWRRPNQMHHLRRQLDQSTPFLAICADYFSYSGHHYLVAVDRYSNWPMVEENAEGSKGRIAALRRVFVTFGIAGELSSDGGPEFMAGATGTFLRNWGVHHHVSSVAHPHSNCKAELGVKTVKRMLVNWHHRPRWVPKHRRIPTSHVSLQEQTRSGVEGQPRRDHIWTPHSRLHSSATWTVSTTLDLARTTGSQGGCATCPTHEGTRATVSAHTCSTSIGHRKLRKAA